VLLCDAEQLSNQLWSVAQVLLDQLGADHAQEGGGSLVGNGLGQQSLAGTWGSVQDDTFRGSKKITNNEIKQLLKKSSLPISKTFQMIQNYYCLTVEWRRRKKLLH
jgi:hypothetical protein